MPLPGLRKISTPIDQEPGKRAKQIRIRVPQPVERPYSIRSRDLLVNRYLRESPAWSVIHKRGLTREMVGQDPLEQRAVPHWQVKGTLPERIVYKYLTDLLRMKDGYEFDFQSSQQGGRMELGGLVADFLFPYLKIIIQVQGPTHSGYLRGRKDEEQRAILEDMGYTTYEIWEDDIYDEYKLDTIMRRIFLRGESAGSGYQLSEAESYPQEEVLPLLDLTQQIFMMVRSL